MNTWGYCSATHDTLLWQRNLERTKSSMLYVISRALHLCQGVRENIEMDDVSLAHPAHFRMIFLTSHIAAICTFKNRLLLPVVTI